MATKTWTLSDLEQDIHIEDCSIGPQDVDGAATDFRVRKRTLRGGLRDGVEVVEVETGTCQLTLIPTRGMGIWRASLAGSPVGWQSPIGGPVHPQYVPLAEPTGLGWLDGFDELLVRCGLESNGAPDFDPNGRLRYCLHGHIANRPAHKLELRIDGDTGEVSLTGVVDETRFLVQSLRLTSTVTVGPDSNIVHIRDRVTNLSANAGEMQLLYHVNLGPPVLQPGARLVVPAKSVAPRDKVAAAHMETWDTYAPPQAGFAEQVAFLDLLADDDGTTQTLLRNADGTLGVSLIFNTRQLPCFTQWKYTAMDADGYVTGLEPGTNFPNPRSFEADHGRVVPLGPRQTVVFDLKLDVHTDATQVAAAEAAVERLRGGTAATVFDSPQCNWSPG